LSPEEIQAQLADYQPDLNADQLELLARFQLLLLRWNKTHNLTAITDPAEMVTHHLIDSISINPYLTAESIADRYRFGWRAARYPVGDTQPAATIHPDRSG